MLLPSDLKVRYELILCNARGINGEAMSFPVSLSLTSSITPADSSSATKSVGSILASTYTVMQLSFVLSKTMESIGSSLIEEPAVGVAIYLTRRLFFFSFRYFAAEAGRTVKSRDNIYSEWIVEL